MFGFGNKGDAIIYAIKQYYDGARNRFPNKRESFYLVLAWIKYALKHHASQYSGDDFVSLLVPALGDTMIFSHLIYPDSRDALAYYMVQKENPNLAKKYEDKFKQLIGGTLQEDKTEFDQRVNSELRYLSTQTEINETLTIEDF
ncbi:MAG: hypothetical protein UU67_C0049G0009 [Candidatus Daviesbacteria bacterium GW2011_GWB1_41_5]|uniref:Uncharacterized protein n=1 Tax=Candidatus Daviesbacteria bacterium GW2011_GWB1_41_5 TaxID=1618429 RepID=A0A0G0WI53_9BACT|nr:MAG: hypothetical protein UU67_C0049G0009 [Candidatus Daviesbacteria bacterium GW2011_GWB1_41_5]